ncbi:MAG: hypothetical protein A3J70_03370 [Elusimicrobia bacterium RIFCSPHIGHO2_02_FULL_61_10]|nr:MAG: hypothetical protein A3I06_00120 [Candidatus Lindowbacteria bacterium RIFCSPLOWO2_02_FULL_62_12]OGH58343.1 MAG: hypothetical protein A3G34_16520 [Candidatus Lindowbacteria bacterium RIFCSPLOWO2_12_FULL_62_27]OGS05924.1 MAG: hypothetical protein A3J70_03370 [Elusimicrobia bacterium RIFCSPHIGHO2_02_FULL_61_10]
MNDGIRRLGRLIVAWCLASLLVMFNTDSLSEAGGPHRNAGTTGAQFLKIDPGARYEAQGGSGVADASSVDAIYWNPAGLAGTDRRRVSFTRHDYIADINMNYLAYVQPTQTNGVWGFALFHLDAGNMARTEVDAAGDPVTGIGNFSAADLAWTVSYGRRINSHGAFGVSGKFIQSRIDSIKGEAWALDAGLRWRLFEQFYVGAAVQNFGTDIKFQSEKFDLPLNYKFGAAFHPLVFKSQTPLRLGIDMNLPSDHRPYYNAGLEIWPAEIFAVRIGYDRRRRDLDRWFTGGFGIRMKAMEFNYTFTPAGDLKNAHRFNFGYEF